jgi:SAM-dependent methyltransferase
LSTLERIQHRKKRAEKYARQRLKRGEETDALLKILEPLWEVRPFTVMDVLDAPELDWDSVPWEIDPVRGGGLRHGTLRGSRKQAQVEAILYVLRTLFQDYPDETKKDEIAGTTLDSQKKIVIADLASGAGNLSLPLAWFLKDIHATVLAVDINPRALERLSKRAEDIGVEIQTLVQDLEKLSSVEVVGGGETTMDYLMNLNCQAIVSLHACGAASDLAIEAAVARDLPFVVSPCCIAKANHVRKANNVDSRKGEILPNLISSQRSGAPVRITYPRSKELETFCVERAVLNDYPLIMTAADYSTGENAKHNVIHQQRGKMSKHIVELDRLKWAEERGYYTRIISIP